MNLFLPDSPFDDHADQLCIDAETCRQVSAGPRASNVVFADETDIFPRQFGTASVLRLLRSSRPFEVAGNIPKLIVDSLNRMRGRWAFSKVVQDIGVKPQEGMSPRFPQAFSLSSIPLIGNGIDVKAALLDIGPDCIEVMAPQSVLLTAWFRIGISFESPFAQFKFLTFYAGVIGDIAQTAMSAITRRTLKNGIRIRHWRAPFALMVGLDSVATLSSPRFLYAN